MRNLGIILICLSALGFVLAVISCLVGELPLTSAEGFSNASTNLALIAIALYVYSNKV